MKNSLINISGKVDRDTVEILSMMDNVSANIGIPFLLIGATARDFIFEYSFDIEAPRATLDIDFGVKVQDWKNYNGLFRELLKLKDVEKTKLEHRLKYKSLLIDIMPFGEIVKDENGLINWQFDKDIAINVSAFQSVFESSIRLQVKESPSLIIRSPSIPGLFALKLMSWHHTYPDRSKDAKDIKFILRNYEFTLEDEELFSYEDILKKEKFDTKYAAIRLMGRKIRTMCDDKLFDYIKTILNEEINEEYSKLVVHMMNRNEDYEDVSSLLLRLKSGMEDGF